MTNHHLRQFGVFTLLLVLAGCASTSSTYKGSAIPAPVEEKVIVDGDVLPLPEQPAYKAAPLEQVAPASPVVSQLLAEAETLKARGDLANTIGTLERAIRIEPRNPVLWNRLADVHFSQQRWQQAVQLAAKSNSLIRNNTHLRRKNWLLMSQSYEAIGNQAQADKYRLKLAR